MDRIETESNHMVPNEWKASCFEMPIKSNEGSMPSFKKKLETCAAWLLKSLQPKERVEHSYSE